MALDFDVLVIGCGPVGLFAAYLFGQMKLRTLIVDKHVDRRGQPKAHAINPRSLEIFRQVGIDVRLLREAGLDPQQVDLVRFVSSFYGREYGSLVYERQFDDVKNLTPEPLFNLSQVAVEEHLATRIQALPDVTTRKPVQWINSQSASNNDVISTLLDRTTQNQYHVQTRYVIACDGSRATSREKLGIAMEPLADRTTHYVTTHFYGQLPGERSGILFFIMQPHGLRTFIRYGPVEWVLVFRFDPNTTAPSTFTPDYCRERILESLGKHVTFKVESITIWSTTPLIARAYRSMTVKNAFLAGDAAHTFSPTGGLGQNTGFGDIHNLSWKMLSVMKEEADDSLLDTFDAERRPVAFTNARQSTINEAMMDDLGKLINPGNTRPDQDTLWELKEFRDKVRKSILRNSEHFNSLDLQLGQIYNAGDRPRDKSVSHFEPRAVAGARLPHAWIVLNGKEASSLDLISYSKFTLLLPNESFLEHLSRVSFDTRERMEVKTFGIDFNTTDKAWLYMVFGSQRTLVVLVRPDQHIAGLSRSVASAVESLPTKHTIRPCSQQGKGEQRP